MFFASPGYLGRTRDSCANETEKLHMQLGRTSMGEQVVGGGGEVEVERGKERREVCVNVQKHNAEQ